MAPRSHVNTWLRLLVAVVFGVLIYQVFVVVLVGILAAVAVPTEYFAWFGKPRQELALAVLDLASALPVLLLVCGAVLATCRAFKTGAWPFLAALLFGMLLCFAYWTANFLFVLPSELPQGVQPYPLSTRVRQLFFLPWWAVPVALAPWLGFALGAWLLLRRGTREA